MPRRVRSVSLLLVPFLLVACVLAACSSGEPDDSGAPTGAASIQALLPRLSAFVERERGLQFKSPLKLTVLSGSAFQAALEQFGSPDRAQIETAQAVLQILGLLPAGVDLIRIVTDADREGTIGFYSPEDKELIVKGGAATPLLRRTIVHELTHALDDQHFGIRRDFESDEATTGWDSLLEGSAVRIEQRYIESLPVSAQEEIQRAEEAQLKRRGELPPVVELGLGFPYVFGPELVGELLRQGGQARLDAAFSSPPRSSEQVIDPQRYLQGDQPLEVPAPMADAPVFDEGEMGQLLLTLLLQSHLDEGAALEAASGWGGDRYVAWRKDMSTCVRAAFAMDTPADSQQLETALSEWASRRPGSVASGGSLTTCG